jgi:hypothetical protein
MAGCFGLFERQRLWMYPADPRTWSVTLVRARLTGTYRSYSIAPDGSVSSQVGVAIGGVQVCLGDASRVLPDLNASALTGWRARLSSLLISRTPTRGQRYNRGSPWTRAKLRLHRVAPHPWGMRLTKSVRSDNAHPSEIPLESGLHEFVSPRLASASPIVSQVSLQPSS